MASRSRWIALASQLWFALALALALGMGLGLVSAARAAPPLPPAVQKELDSAVMAYESGRLAPARQAFETLARRRVPAAE